VKEYQERVGDFLWFYQIGGGGWGLDKILA